MTSINRVTLVGHIGSLETRYTANGLAVLTISLATSERVKAKDTSEITYVPEWHRVVCFGKVAENIGANADKGTKLFVEGSLKTNKYKDKQTGHDRYSTQITADRVEILAKRAGSEKEPSDQIIKENRPSTDNLEDFDIPF